MQNMVSEFYVQVRERVRESQGTLFKIFGGNPDHAELSLNKIMRI